MRTPQGPASLLCLLLSCFSLAGQHCLPPREDQGRSLGPQFRGGGGPSGLGHLSPRSSGLWPCPLVLTALLRRQTESGLDREKPVHSPGRCSHAGPRAMPGRPAPLDPDANC